MIFVHCFLFYFFQIIFHPGQLPPQPSQEVIFSRHDPISLARSPKFHFISDSIYLFIFHFFAKAQTQTQAS